MRKALAVMAAFIRRDWAIARSYRLPFVLDVVGAVAALAFFFYLSRLVDRSKFASKTDLDQDYFAFAVIGLSVLTILQTGLLSFARKFRDDQTTGTLEALMATPASPRLLVLGSAAYDILRATIFGVIIVLLAVVVFGLRLDVAGTSALVACVTLPALVLLLVAIGVAVAAFTVVFKQATALLGLVTSALSLLGGVYFPPELLPSPLRQMADALPFTWGLDVLRDALLGGDISAARFIGLVCSSVVALVLALALFQVALNYAKRAGTLAQY